MPLELGRERLPCRVVGGFDRAPGGGDPLIAGLSREVDRNELGRGTGGSGRSS